VSAFSVPPTRWSDPLDSSVPQGESSDLAESVSSEEFVDADSQASFDADAVGEARHAASRASSAYSMSDPDMFFDAADEASLHSCVALRSCPC
jgi:hypothetical protein